MLFCPRCSNLLLLDTEGSLSFVCQTCPYTHRVEKKMQNTLTLERKKVPEIESSKNWSKVDSQAKCPKCSNLKAYYFELQTRSADEPMTIFYKCATCEHVWRD